MQFSVGIGAKQDPLNIPFFWSQLIFLQKVHSSTRYFKLVITFSVKARKCHGSVIIDQRLFVIGGTDSRSPVLNTESLDLTNISLAPLQPIKNVPIDSSNYNTAWRIEGI